MFRAAVFWARSSRPARWSLPRRWSPRLKAARQAWQPSVYLGIEPDGTVKIVAHRSEMGTGCRTGLPMIVADELEADWARVQVIQALGDAKYGSQDTDGSCSVRDFYDPLRTAGATARTMLENAAAGQVGRAGGGMPRAEPFRGARQDRAASWRMANWSPLAATATAPQQDAVRSRRPPSSATSARTFPIVDLKPIVTGKAIFGIDARMPGMVYASIERPPVIGATLKSCDDAEAKQVKGVAAGGHAGSGQAAIRVSSRWAARR